MKRRLLSILLSILMITSVCPTFAVAAVMQIEFVNTESGIAAKVTGQQGDDVCVTVVKKSVLDDYLKGEEEELVYGGVDDAINKLETYGGTLFSKQLPGVLDAEESVEIELKGFDQNDELVGWAYDTTSGASGAVRGSAKIVDGKVAVPQSTLVFDLQGGTKTGGELSVSVDAGTEITLADHAPEGVTRAGYKFLGWAESAGQITESAVVEKVTAETEGNTKTVYAVWEEKTTPVASGVTISATYKHGLTLDDLDLAGALSSASATGSWKWTEATTTSVSAGDSQSKGITSVETETHKGGVTANVTLNIAQGAVEVNNLPSSIEVINGQSINDIADTYTSKLTTATDANEATKTDLEGAFEFTTAGSIKDLGAGITSSSTVGYEFTPTDNTNYAAKTGTINVTVKAAQNLTVTNFADAAITYGAEAPEFAPTVKAGEETLAKSTDYKLQYTPTSGGAAADTLPTSAAGKVKAGTYTVSIVSLKAAYNSPSDTATLTVNPKTINVELGSAPSKEYDGDTTVDSPAVTLNESNKLSSDTVSLKNSITAAYDNKNAGTGKTVTYSGIELEGTDSANYALPTSGGWNTRSDGVITAKNVTLQNISITKEWDGTTDLPTLVLSAANMNGFISGDNLTVDVGDSAFNSSNVANPAEISGDNFEFTLGGTDAKNYNLTTTSLSGGITKATLTLQDTISALTRKASDTENASLESLLAYAKQELPKTVSVKNSTNVKIADAVSITWAWTGTPSFNAKGATYGLTGTIAGTANYSELTTAVNLTVSAVQPVNPTFADDTIGIFTTGDSDPTNGVATNAAAVTVDEINTRYSGKLPTSGTVKVQNSAGSDVDAAYTIAWTGTIDAQAENSSGVTFNGTITYTDNWVTAPGSSTVTRKLTVTAKDTATVTLAAPGTNPTYDGAVLTKSDLGAITVNAGGSVTPNDSELKFQYSKNSGNTWDDGLPKDAGTYQIKVTYETLTHLGVSNTIEIKIQPKSVAVVLPTFIASKTYGEAKTYSDLGLTLKPEDIIPSESVSITGATLTVDGLAATASVGNYKLSTVTLNDANYTAVVPLADAFIVNAAPLTVSDLTVKKSYDALSTEGNAVITGTMTGAQNGESVTIDAGFKGTFYNQDGLNTVASVADAKKFKFTSYELKSNDQKTVNYTLKQDTASDYAIGEITAVDLTITGQTAISKTTSTVGSLKLSDFIATAALLADGDTIASLFNDAVTPDGSGAFTAKGVTVKLYSDAGRATPLTALPTTEGTYYFTVSAAAANGQPNTNYNLLKLNNTDGILTVTKKTSSGGGGGGTPSYKVSFDAGDNGKIVKGNASVSVNDGSKLTEAKLPTVEPKEGYKFLGWSVDGKTVVDPTSDKVTKAVTYIALYGPALTDQHIAYIKGYDGNVFRPDVNITRAEMATIIARVLDEDIEVGGSGETSFSDVAASEWYAAAIAKMEAKGIMNGYADGTFQPNANISREELAAVVARMNGVVAAAEMPFTDVKADAWSADSIYTVYKNGWVSGYADGTFRPSASVTRAETVRIMNGMLSRSITADSIRDAEYNTFSDISTTHWAYFDVIEASNAHDYSKTDDLEVWTK